MPPGQAYQTMRWEVPHSHSPMVNVLGMHQRDHLIEYFLPTKNYLSSAVENVCWYTCTVVVVWFRLGQSMRTTWECVYMVYPPNPALHKTLTKVDQIIKLTSPDRWGVLFLLPLGCFFEYSDSNVHGVNMGPSWILSAPDGPHVAPRNLAIIFMLPTNKPLNPFVWS